MTAWFPGRVPGVSPRLRGDRYGPRVVSAGLGRRLGAVTIDWILSLLVASLITGSPKPGGWHLLVFFCEYVFFLTFFGRTPGMRLLHLRVVRFENGAPPGLWNSVIRTILLMLVIPAVVWDSDQRGMHDKATGTVVVLDASEAS